ncbi:hypothetical protein MCY_01344 [Bartonella rattimassiliensis 15908]|uniref:Uncharacterized protein n=1 Tax=Bartonella rattimassiliensis 15908 TaxID=1094556 RepID=J0QHJ6_9HYPH|nr:hypothetical protein MCY_01344 [Bartonella rattimassiliensis 15908]
MFWVDFEMFLFVCRLMGHKLFVKTSLRMWLEAFLSGDVSFVIGGF